MKEKIFSRISLFALFVGLVVVISGISLLINTKSSLDYSSSTVHVYAVESSGTITDTVNNCEYSWSYESSTKTLTVQGVPDLDDASDAPWYSYKNQIQQVVVNPYPDFESAYIGNNAFKYYSELQTLYDHDVYWIGDYAFYGCSKLTTFDQGGWSHVGDYAFSNCTLLGEYDIYSSYVGSSAYSDCTSLTGCVSFSYSCEIGDYAFSGCTGITSVDFSASSCKIGAGAFYGCTGIVSANLWDSDYQVSSNCFGGCTSLRVVTWAGNGYPYGGYCGLIGSEAFAGCTSLESIDLTTELETIEDSAFDGCSSLTDIVLPDKLEQINNCAFRGCSSIVSITFPESMSSIDALAFSGCTSLTTVIVEGSSVAVSSSAFNGCTNFRSIYVNDECLDELIGDYGWSSYEDKIKLISLMPIEATVDGLKYEVVAGEATIVGYTTVPSNMIVPSNVMIESTTYPVVAIANGAFNGANLESVTFNSAQPITMGSNVFGSNSQVKLYVPKGKSSTYTNAESWMAYSEQIEEIPETGIELNLSILLVTLVLGGALIAISFKRKEHNV